VSDRLCSPTAPARADWAAEQGIDTVLVPGGDDGILAETLVAVAPDAVVLAGYLRLVGPAVLDCFGGQILNVHPSLLPAFPGLHGVRDALAAGVAVTGVTVHLVDATLDGGPIVAQEAVDVRPDDDEASLLERLHAVEHRLLPLAVADLLAGALSRSPGARRARFDPATADARVPVPRRALLSSRTRPFKQGASARASSFQRARHGRCARPACRSRTSPRSPASRRCSTGG
jgi:phosphoribosylglycinamide formyltransferase-1